MKASPLCLVVILAACSATTPVRKIGPETYVVDYSQRARVSGWADIKSRAYAAAEAHCASMGQQMEQVSMDTHGVQGWSRVGAELTFKCVPK